MLIDSSGPGKAHERDDRHGDRSLDPFKKLEQEWTWALLGVFTLGVLLAVFSTNIADRVMGAFLSFFTGLMVFVKK